MEVEMNGTVTPSTTTNTNSITATTGTAGTSYTVTLPAEDKPVTPEYNIADVIAAVGVEAILKDPTVNAEVTSRRDRSVTQALNTARTKWQNEAQKKATEAADEATRLASMSAEEKERYQFEKDKQEFERQRAEFNHKNLVLETSRQLIDAGLPDLADFITGKDAEETSANIAKVTDILGVWKSAQLSNAMRGKTPKEMRVSQTLSREDIKHMSKEEINKAFEQGLLKDIK